MTGHAPPPRRGTSARPSPARPLVAVAGAAVLVGAGLFWAGEADRWLAGGTPSGPPAPEAADDALPAQAATMAPRWDAADWEVFAGKVRWAVTAGLDTVPLGTAMVRLGETFVGTPYAAGTLDPDGPERVVVNFRGLDCVTFVETVFALARFVGEGGATLLDRPSEAEIRFEELLADLRYRGGRLGGYGSRLHYFSDWIGDNAARGRVLDLSDELEAILDPEPTTFMSAHPGAYRQLADPANLAAVLEAEHRLSAAGRRYVPQFTLPAVADRIRDGDIVAATSTVPGLDVAHTGLAIWRGGRLHLLHAPLDGRSVEVSERPLAERLLAIPGQDGVMAARPLG